MIRLPLILILIFCTYQCVLAQTSYVGKKKIEARLKIGDRVPEKIFNRIGAEWNRSNAEPGKERKLVILDFWGINCTVCIAAMPEMQKLQNEFGDRLQVVLVTKNSTEQVESLRKRLPIFKKVSLPMVNDDTVFSRMFSYKSVPTHVWIDQNGVVRQITEGWNTTRENIQKYLDGGNLSLPEKKERSDFDITAPLWLEGGGRQAKYLKYYSYVMNRITDYSSGSALLEVDSSTGKICGVKAINVLPYVLYELAFSKTLNSEFTESNRIILEFKNRQQYQPPADPALREIWADEYLFCYEIRVPPEMSGSLFDYMKQDLQRYFKITGDVKKRKIDCMVLVRNSDVDKLKSKGGSQIDDLSADNSQLTVRNMAVASLINKLKYTYAFGKTPILNETNYVGNIDIELKGDLKNPSALRKALNEYGLDLVMETREMDVLVLRDEN